MISSYKRNFSITSNNIMLTNINNSKILKLLKILTSVLFVFLTGCLPVEKIASQPPPTQNFSHTIADDSLGLIQLWSVSGIKMWRTVEDVQFGLVDNYLVLVDYIDSSRGTSPKLLGLDSNTGELVWESQLSNCCYSFISGQDSVFITTDHSLQSYDISTGMMNWENNEVEAIKIYSMQIEGNELYAYYVGGFFNNNEQVIYTLDIPTGKLIDTQIIKNPISGLWFQDNNVYYWKGGNKVWATDKANSKIRWEITLDTFSLNLESIGESLMIFTGRVDNPIYAIDMKDGSTKWKSEQQLISNSVIENGSVYALVTGEELLRLDLYTGDIIGMTRFTSKSNSHNESAHNLIAVSSNVIAVYFGDNSQLVVYEIAK